MKHGDTGLVIVGGRMEMQPHVWATSLLFLPLGFLLFFTLTIHAHIYKLMAKAITCNLNLMVFINLFEKRKLLIWVTEGNGYLLVFFYTMQGQTWKFFSNFIRWSVLLMWVSLYMLSFTYFCWLFDSYNGNDFRFDLCISSEWS